VDGSCPSQLVGDESGKVVIRKMRLDNRARQHYFLVLRDPVPEFVIICKVVDDGLEPTWSRITSTPVTLIDPYLGVGDAWSVIKAADAAWTGGVGAWTSLYEPGPESAGP